MIGVDVLDLIAVSKKDGPALAGPFICLFHLCYLETG